VDETTALEALSGVRNATQEQIQRHQGRIANTAGDSVLAEFGSAVEAVDCAIALQQQLSSRTQGEDLQARIGIHLGDVVNKAGDLFGTAVNIAARLEGFAQQIHKSPDAGVRQQHKRLPLVCVPAPQRLDRAAYRKQAVAWRGCAGSVRHPGQRVAGG